MTTNPRMGSTFTNRGFTLLELLVAMSIGSILMGLSVFAMLQLEYGYTGASELGAYLKITRAKALASSSAYTVTPTSTGTITASFGTTCAATQTADPSMNFSLPKKSRLGSTSWSLCYSPRGIADSSIVIPVIDDRGTKTVEVYLGGGVKIR